MHRTEETLKFREPLSSHNPPSGWSPPEPTAERLFRGGNKVMLHNSAYDHSYLLNKTVTQGTDQTSLRIQGGKLYTSGLHWMSAALSSFWATVPQ